MGIVFEWYAGEFQSTDHRGDIHTEASCEFRGLNTVQMGWEFPVWDEEVHRFMFSNYFFEKFTFLVVGETGVTLEMCQFVDQSG
ncbi:MAG: hypothetical protein ACREQ5_02135 [Candidatus Dormibacteria bacterium]